MNSTDRFSFCDSILVARSPEQVYDLVSDVTRTGEWSPICRACWWDDDSGPVVGNWFTGRNEVPGRIWETRSQVVAAERGRRFAWLVSGKYAYWSYETTPADGGTRLTESWEFGLATLAFFHEKYGEQAAAQIDDRVNAARSGIPVTLAAIKTIAEAG